MELVTRFFPIPEQGFFLFGPRGTGKSTWLRRCFPEALFIDLLKPAVYRQMSARPETLAERVRGFTGKEVVVDEVQRVPELLSVVHDLIERAPLRRFVLTGSSARKLRRGGVDLLAGRALRKTLHPFMAAELPGFELAAALERGLLPLVVAAPEPQEVLDAYAMLYLEEEVQFEGWARNVGHFARFLEVVSFSHAAVLNVSHVARECEVERKTVVGYVDVLEDLLLSFRLPVFTKRARRKTVAHPKFYLFDAGVYRSLRPRGPLDRAEEIDGSAFEGLVAQHLRAWIAYSGSDCKLSYWRTRSGVEVDFVVYGGDGFWALEVKNTGRIRPEDLRGLRGFMADYPECEALLLYRGRDRLKIDGIWCLPGEEFLRRLKPSAGLTDGL
ncbi:MAG: ATP-binding protein [bacterium]|nr:ATP-binding protein [bacterium]